MAEENIAISSPKLNRLDESKVHEAATALVAFHKKRQQEANKKALGDLLLNDCSQIKLIISVWKIVGKKAKTFQITVPHPLRTSETEICLFAKDDKKMDTEGSKRHYQQLLERKEITEVNEVMPLQVLKKEFRDFESRRQLAKRYDLFLVDERIFRLMHVHLGKEFYKRKKYPTSVNMTKNDLKKEIQRAINSTRFILSNRGNTNHLAAAHTGMTVDQIVENIMAAIKEVTLHIPMGWNNIKAVYVRTDESVSLPLHTSLVFTKWEAGPKIDSTDIWRLKKQLHMTGGKNVTAKARPTVEEEIQARRFREQPKTKKKVIGAHTGKKTAKRKAKVTTDENTLKKAKQASTGGQQ